MHSRSAAAKRPHPHSNRPAATAPHPQAEAWLKPWVQLKYVTFHPCVYPNMLLGASSCARPGDAVHVYDREGSLFGLGLYNPGARVPLRIYHHGRPTAEREQHLDDLLERALKLRLAYLGLPAKTDAFRVVHSDGDGMSGLVVDRFDDLLSFEVHSLGIYQRLSRWIPRLHEALGTRHVVVSVDDRIARVEGIDPGGYRSGPVHQVKILESGIRFEVDWAQGHKTGFFCDQRDNRRRLADFTARRRVLDLCCYTGGFALAAKVLGQAAEVIGVDLDEKAIALAKRNANLNQVRVEWVHCDAFAYTRQMLRNKTRWDVVVVDPPKLILSREEFEDGLRKYEDLNTLATRLVVDGGLLVTCSCSGLLPALEFEQMVIRAVHRQGRRLQILDRTGAAPDHPVMSNCPESLYLKVIWARVL
jgi:23S rRNA (cytosine1962-C5)-methyltransferase